MDKEKTKTETEKKVKENTRKHTLFPLIAVMIILSVFLCGIWCNPVYAEGESINLSLVLSRSVLNKGKEFTLTLYANPNMNIKVQSFDLVIGYDPKMVVPVLSNTGGDQQIKVQKSAKAPGSFNIVASKDGGEIVVLGMDDSPTMNNPFVLSGNTAVIDIYFKVLDSATEGSSASFSLARNKAVFNVLHGDTPEMVALEYGPAKSAPVGPKLETNAYLKSLNINIGELTPKFSKKTNKYTLDVSEDIDGVEITAAAESKKAKMVISGGKSLNYGANKATVKVTAEDEDVVRTYTITINRAKPPSPTPDETSSLESSSQEESSEDFSSSEESGVSGSDLLTSEISSALSSQENNTEITPKELLMWKTAAIIFFLISVILGITLTWLLINKRRSDRDNIRIRRV